VGNARDGVKVLGAGRLRNAVTLRVHRVSAGARAAVEKAGGTVELLDVVAAEPVGDAVAEAHVTAGAEGADEPGPTE
jgi:large subunit ribosomal protein L15